MSRADGAANLGRDAFRQESGSDRVAEAAVDAAQDAADVQHLSGASAATHAVQRMT